MLNSLCFKDKSMNAVSLHDKIDSAKNLLLKESRINGKTHTVAFFTENFNVSMPELLALAKDNLIELHNYFLQQGYINEYKRRRAELLAKLHKIQIASFGSGSGYRNTPETEKAFSDQYCGLGKGYYDKLVNGMEIRLDVFSFENLSQQQNDMAKKFIRFDIKFSPQKIQEFLDEKIDGFIKYELDLAEKVDSILEDKIVNLSYDKTHRFFSYQKQKESFAIGMVNEFIKGYPKNNLKIDYTQIWKRNEILKVNFIETALAMEKEGLIEIKDIIYPKIGQQTVITSELFWKYPITIRLKTLSPAFDDYYGTIYRKHKHPKEDSVPQKTIEHERQETKNTPKKEIDGVVLGPLEYKHKGIYHNDSILDLTPQAVKLCKLFIERPDEYISDDTIKETITKNDFVSTENMQKIVSKLRKTLNKENRKIKIKRISNSGYKFIAKEIL